MASSINESVSIFNHNRTFPKCLSRCNSFSVHDPLFTPILNTTEQQTTEIRAGDKVSKYEYKICIELDNQKSQLDSKRFLDYNISFLNGYR